MQPAPRTATPTQRRAARRGVLWTVAALVAAQVVFWGLKEARPEVRDPEYGHKIRRLRDRIRENPGRPVVVLLGSSRVAFGVRTELLEANRPGAAGEPIVFNFGMANCTPVLQRLMLRRLLADGIRPAYVVAEFFPPVLPEGDVQVEHHIQPARLSRSDVRLLRRFTDEPGRFRRDWLETQLVPVFSHRHLLLNLFAAPWVPRENRFSQNWAGMDGWGWTPRDNFRRPMPAATLRNYMAERSPSLRELLLAWHVSPQSDRALREIVGVCRREGVGCALLWTPEPTWLRDCYPPETRVEIDAYASTLQRDLGVRLIDGREWVPDGQFYEEMHVTHAGAETCARAFEREALPLLRAGRSLVEKGGVRP